jgi:hypothetical protein
MSKLKRRVLQILSMLCAALDYITSGGIPKSIVWAHRVAMHVKESVFDKLLVVMDVAVCLMLAASLNKEESVTVSNSYFAVFLLARDYVSAFLVVASYGAQLCCARPKIAHPGRFANASLQRETEYAGSAVAITQSNQNPSAAHADAAVSRHNSAVQKNLYP